MNTSLRRVPVSREITLNDVERVYGKVDFGINDPELVIGAASPGGTKCPTCSQHVQIYKRQINATMCEGLFILYNYYIKNGLDISEPVHIPELLRVTETKTKVHPGDVAKLRYWGLLNILTKERETDKSGYYVLLEKGVKFLCERISVPQYAVIYNGELICLTGQEITIRNALGRKFNYTELMNQYISF